MANETQSADYGRGWCAGYRAGIGAAAPYSSNMRAILATIARAGLLWAVDAQGHKQEQVRPVGSVFIGPQGDKYGLALWGEGTGAALAGLAGDIAQALGVEWARVDLVGEGRAFVVLPHKTRGDPQG